MSKPIPILMNLMELVITRQQVSSLFNSVPEGQRTKQILVDICAHVHRGIMNSWK